MKIIWYLDHAMSMLRENDILRLLMWFCSDVTFLSIFWKAIQTIWKTRPKRPTMRSQKGMMARCNDCVMHDMLFLAASGFD